MKINFLNKNILTPLIGGSIVLLSFIYVQVNKSNNIYIPQTEQLKNDIIKIDSDYQKLLKYKSSELGDVKENYINFVKELTMLYKQTPEVIGLSILVNDSQDGLLNSAVKTSDKNVNIKYISCQAKITLKNETEYDKNDFYTIYKPLLYFQNVMKRKTVIVEQISREGSSYSIKFKILGK
jgi:hypothetical protein